MKLSPNGSLDITATHYSSERIDQRFATALVPGFQALRQLKLDPRDSIILAINIITSRGCFTTDPTSGLGTERRQR